MELTLDQALQKGIEAHKAGKAQEADRYYTAILKANPKHPDANHNMGVLAVGVGKVQEALPFFKTALEVSPKIAQFWLSYIDALIKLDRLDDAKAVFNQAKNNGVKGDSCDDLEKQINATATRKSNTREPSQTQLKSLIGLYTKGQYQEVLGKGFQLLEQFPNSINLYNIIGAANKGLGKLEEAIKAYNKALSIKPDYAESYYNMGNTLKEQGKLDEAIEAYNKALSIKPDFAEAYYNMGVVLQDQIKSGEAIEAYNKALSIKPDYAEAYYNMRIALRGMIFNKPSRELQNTIVSLLDSKTYARPSDIASAAISLLKFEPGLQKCLQLADNEVIEGPEDIISELSELSLLVKLMSICPIPDLGLENLFRKLRSSLLLSISDITSSSELLSFQSVLALQCFTNEYIYNSTEEEEEAIVALSKIVKKSLDKKKQPSPQIVLALASYKALNQYEWSNSLLVNDEIEDVFTRQVAEPNQEAKLKPLLPLLDNITDEVSSKVRDQYEESPYPRWVNTGFSSKPMSISKTVEAVKLKLHNDKITEVEKPEILIAGCGTGQHSIGTASRFKDSKVLAIDLSLSSLAYAKRKTEELGVENIEYMQADILDLGKLERQFDIVESAGVLHHMDDPEAGWKVLTDCLKPGGLMKIGLYSELARQHIVKIRKEISDAGIGSSDEEMKSFRDTIIVSEKDHHERILISSDFYSLSELKDLLFHIQEHSFTIPLIKHYLDKLGLKFCGFERKQIVSHFTQTNKAKKDPYDLDKWRAYEEANPRAFAGMYQFWCQKVG